MVPTGLAVPVLNQRSIGYIAVHLFARDVLDGVVDSVYRLRALLAPVRERE